VYLQEAPVAVSEKRKHDLYVRVTESLGPEQAETLMEMLQPTGDEAPATKADLAELREEFFGLRGELHGDFRDLRSEFNGLRAEFNGLRRDVQSWLWTGMAVQTAVIGLLLTIVR
jgi:hypothetical protein